MSVPLTPAERSQQELIDGCRLSLVHQRTFVHDLMAKRYTRAQIFHRLAGQLSSHISAPHLTAMLVEAIIESVETSAIPLPAIPVPDPTPIMQPPVDGRTWDQVRRGEYPNEPGPLGRNAPVR